MKVVKRDGTFQEFDTKRIFNAVHSAALSVGYFKEDADIVADTVTTKVVFAITCSDEGITVEEVQNKVEQVLMPSKWKDVAKCYIAYRSNRDRVREEKSSYVQMGLDVLRGRDLESQKENCNLPRDSMATKLEVIKRNYHKKIANEFVLPEKFRKLHDTGDLHIHDVDSIISKYFNCCLMDYPAMFELGFQLGNKWIDTPNTILTAMNVLVQMVQVQSNLQFGGISLADIDVHLTKFIEGSYNIYITDALEDLGLEEVTDYVENIATRKTEREVYRAAKLLSYQLNTLQVRGESSPFVTITYGSATSKFGRMIQKAVLQERLDEFERSGVQAFPKHQFILEEGVNLNPEDVNYDIFQLAMKTSAKTCYPDWIFPENQRKHTGGNASYMGCRSLLSPWFNDQGEKQYLGRANVSVVSLNLPRIAMESKGDIVTFFDILQERLDSAIEISNWRFDRLVNTKAKDASFTYQSGVLGKILNPDDTVASVFEGGRGSVSIGYIGLHEVVLSLFGKESYEDEGSFNFQKEVLSFINNRLEDEKLKTSRGFSLYSTPSESLTDRFCKLDQAKFGMIKGVTDKGFYINSFHVNTETVMTPFEKIDLESELQSLALGGHIVYVESNNLSGNLKAYESLIKYAYGKGIMHFGVNAGWDFCKSCHWTGELEVSEDSAYKYECPSCRENDSDQVVLTRRLCGYVTSMGKRPPVEGRIKEIKSRVKHR
ncbi:anaerobic ribonucleoside-triphosphate reductase [Vibrio phage 1.063.O._10N.261.45.C7]|nr:anaerobic ribonucleoside-triphosphate reductase [Vibrio phage 1.063.O._10N.261.45.C7]